MLGLKDISELDDYLYKVCEISNCENEALDIFESSDDRIIDVCDLHNKILNDNKWTLW
jgi:hypothetical protein